MPMTALVTTDAISEIDLDRPTYGLGLDTQGQRLDANTLQTGKSLSGVTLSAGCEASLIRCSSGRVSCRAGHAMSLVRGSPVQMSSLANSNDLPSRTRSRASTPR